MWIKVSDRIPEYSSWVLCFPKSVTDTVPFVTNWPAGSALASHWMPLPSPPTADTLELLEAVSTMVGGTSVPSREELDCAAEQLDICIAQLRAGA